ncbi:MAG: glycosyltransferase [Candidatus Jordarchaeum sp.]|uniref:glycosyltransferase n=1 Tax=Candidatus Jordarchaeum sp. TaxID=2823881 RepID=UPI004049DE14
MLDNKNNAVEVSVVIPFYNARETLKECLDSLLNQTYPKNLFEIILIDDCSTDESGETLEINEALKNGFNLKLVRLSKRSGPAAARNQGIKKSRGKIIAFTDADCILDRKWLENLVQSFKNRIGGVFGETKTFSEDVLIWPLVLAPITSSFKYTTCNIAYSKDVLAEVGSFDERFKEPFREDTDLALSVIKKGFQIERNPKAVVYHPVRIQSTSQILHTALRYQYDNLLYKKHANSISSETSRFLMPYVGPFSPIGLAFILAFIMLTVGLLHNSILSLILFLGLIGCYLIFFIAYGYRFVSLEKSPVPFSLRLKCAATMPFFITLLLIARLYGSIKFKKFLL